MRISDSTIEDIKQAADILEVVEDFLPLKKKGTNWWALSPFTNEKTPSFAVNPAKGIFKCFSTGKGGDSISFIMEMEGVGYLEALKHLAGKYGIEIEQEEQTPEQLAQQNQKESLYAVLSFANKYYQKLLRKSDEGRSIGLSYFKERGFKDRALETFELGYSLDQWDAFEKEALKHGFKSDILVAAGMLLEKEENKRRYDRFRGRVMFPIHNISGRVIGFGARTLKSDKSAKYLNSPESDVYHKSDVLYGIYQAKKAIRNLDTCYLVEGYTDVISLHQAGVENVVASSGTSLTDNQIRLIQRFTKNVTVLYDGDSAGIKAAMRGVDMLLAQDLNVKVVQFPSGQDPDSYVQEVGGEKFQQFLNEESKDFILFKTRLFLAESKNDPVKRGEAVRDIVRSIAKIPDPIKRTVFYQQCSDLLGVSEELLAQEGTQIIEEEKRREAKRQSYQKKKEQRQQSRPSPPPSGKGQSKPAEVSMPDSLDDLENLSFSEEGEGWQLDADGFEGSGEAAPEQVSDKEQPSTKAELITTDPEQEAIFKQEEETIRLLLQYGKATLDGENYIADYILSEIGDVYFQHGVYKTMIEGYRQAKAEGKAIEAEAFLSHENPKVREMVSGLLMGNTKHEVSKNWWERHKIFVPPADDDLGKIAYQHVLRLKFRMLKKLVAQVQQNIKTAKSDAEMMDALQLYQELKQQENELAKMLGISYS